MSIRHVCETGGCYIKVATPDWGFTDCAFSGKIRIGDIDGIVEVNSHLLILEWKGIEVPLGDGQRIMYERITKRSDITAIVVWGDAESSEVSSIRIYEDGEITYDKVADNNTLVNICKRWEAFARNN